jgi:hypothetical protein
MGSKSSKVRRHGAEKRPLSAQEAETPFVTKLSSEDLKMYRANEYDTPTHNARTTSAYSVSFPV